MCPTYSARGWASRTTPTLTPNTSGACNPLLVLLVGHEVCENVVVRPTPPARRAPDGLHRSASLHLDKPALDIGVLAERTVDSACHDVLPLLLVTKLHARSSNADSVAPVAGGRLALTKEDTGPPGGGPVLSGRCRLGSRRSSAGGVQSWRHRWALAPCLARIPPRFPG